MATWPLTAPCAPAVPVAMAASTIPMKIRWTDMFHSEGKNALSEPQALQLAAGPSFCNPLRSRAGHGARGVRARYVAGVHAGFAAGSHSGARGGRGGRPEAACRTGIERRAVAQSRVDRDQRARVDARGG